MGRHSKGVKPANFYNKLDIDKSRSKNAAFETNIPYRYVKNMFFFLLLLQIVAFEVYYILPVCGRTPTPMK